jgi:hypothetical protein
MCTAAEIETSISLKCTAIFFDKQFCFTTFEEKKKLPVVVDVVVC